MCEDKAEVLAGRSFTGLPQAQLAFEHWCGIYNHERPHDALNLQTPAQRYATSLWLQSCTVLEKSRSEMGDRLALCTASYPSLQPSFGHRVRGAIVVPNS